MGLVRHEDAQQISRSAIVLDMGDLEQQARKLREAAEQRAQQIIEDAKQHAQDAAAEARQHAIAQGREQGYQEGFAQGVEQGAKEASQQHSESLEQINQTLTDVLNKFQAEQQTLRNQAVDQVLATAMMFTEKVLHRVLEIDRAIVIDQLAEALNYVLRPSEVTVRISPEDRQVIEQALPELQSEFHNVRHVYLIEDQDVEPGGCKLTYGQGAIDATLSTQLGRIVRAMLPGEHPAAELLTHPVPEAEQVSAPDETAAADAGLTSQTIEGQVQTGESKTNQAQTDESQTNQAQTGEGPGDQSRRDDALAENATAEDAPAERASINDAPAESATADDVPDEQASTRNEPGDQHVADQQGTVEPEPVEPEFAELESAEPEPADDDRGHDGILDDAHADQELGHEPVDSAQAAEDSKTVDKAA